MLVCIFTGFASGLPLYFLINLIPAWLRSEQVDLKSIGLMALIGLPFTWKFLWSPLMDAVRLPVLGRRRGWMLLTQAGLLAALAAYAFLNPRNHLPLIAGLSVLVAFFSASQDIVLDAFRREILSDEELGLGNSVHVNAYRVAALIPGSLSLVLADRMPWSEVFVITSLFMLPGLLMTLFLAHEPVLPPSVPKTLKQTVVEPFKEFFTRKGIASAVCVLLFIFLYKLGDSMATALATPFYLDMGFSKTDIGLIAKNAGLWPAVAAGILGGVWMLKIGVNKALWLFGAVQAITVLGFVWLAGFGHFDTVGTGERLMLAAVIGAEAVGVGLGTAAFVSYMARETNPAFTATQLALFTSLSAVPREVPNLLLVIRDIPVFRQIYLGHLITPEAMLINIFPDFPAPRRIKYRTVRLPNNPIFSCRFIIFPVSRSAVHIYRKRTIVPIQIFGINKRFRRSLQKRNRNQTALADIVIQPDLFPMFLLRYVKPLRLFFQTTEPDSEREIILLRLQRTVIHSFGKAFLRPHRFLHDDNRPVGISEQAGKFRHKSIRIFRYFSCRIAQKPTRINLIGNARSQPKGKYKCKK